MTDNAQKTPSDNTQALIDRILQRESLGLKKYGVTLDRTDLMANEWIQHAQDEALDLSAYLEGLKRLATAQQAELVRLREDAAKWRALASCARMRVIGSAGIGTEFAHIGVEFWANHPEETQPSSRQQFTEFVNQLAALTPGATHER